MPLAQAERTCALGLMLVDHAEFRRDDPPPFLASYDCRGVWPHAPAPEAAGADAPRRRAAA